jgi:oligosaccharyltransferase complex subunit beta
MLGKISVLLLLSISMFSVAISSGSNATSLVKERSLVLLDDWHYLETHSLFFDQLRALNIELDFKIVDDPTIQLTYYGDYIYQSIIFLAPTFSDDLSKKNDLKLANILKFIDNGHDIMIFANSEVSGYIRKLANEFGVDFDDYVY